MKIEGVFMEAPESYQTRFCVCPKAFYPVNMRVLIGEFIFAVLNSKMLLVPKVYKAIIASPAVGVDCAFKGNLATNNTLQGCF